MGCESTLLGNRHAKFTLIEVWLCMEKMTVVYIINFMDFKNVHVNVLAQTNDQFFNMCYVLKYMVVTLHRYTYRCTQVQGFVVGAPKKEENISGDFW